MPTDSAARNSGPHSLVLTVKHSHVVPLGKWPQMKHNFRRLTPRSVLRLVLDLVSFISISSMSQEQEKIKIYTPCDKLEIIPLFPPHGQGGRARLIVHV